MSTDVAHDILGFVPESESTSLGPIAVQVPALTGAHYYPGYKDQLARVLFLEAAYKGGPSFKNAKDRAGDLVFVQHERESDLKFKRRKRLTSYRNYVGPIIDTYANYVMSTSPVRSKRTEFMDWCRNVDRKGNNIQQFFKAVLVKAALIGKHWVGVDLPRAPDGVVLTAANDQRAPYLVSVSHANIVDFEVDRTGKPTRLVIHHEVYVKKGFGEEARLEHEYHEWTDEKLVIWRPVQKNRSSDNRPEENVVSTLPSTDGALTAVPQAGYTLERQQEVPHGYKTVPFRCVTFFQGKGIAEDIAEANKTVLNLTGILYEELFNSTFSQTYISGVSADESSETTMGSQNVIFLPNPEAGVHTASANPEAANSIMNALFNEVKEIHRMAHMEQSGEPLQKRVAEAASAKEKDSESMDQVLEDMADMMEGFENDILRIVSGMKTKYVTEKDVQTKYSKVFDTKTLREKIALIVELDKAPYMPPQIVKGLVRMVLEDILEDGPEAQKTIKDLADLPDSTSPQGLAVLNFKKNCGVIGPVQVYQMFNPGTSDEEARKALQEIADDREKFAVEVSPDGEKSDRPQGRPEAQPTPEERRKAKEKQQAANQT